MNMNRKLKNEFGNNVKAKLIDDKVILSGEVSSWDEKVSAGLLVAKQGSRVHVVNDIVVKNLVEAKTIVSSINDKKLEGKKPDVLIIGGGVVGCAIARELSKYDLDILLVEKEYDVALHASSRNDGMVHPGIDIKPGLLKKKLNNIGNEMYDDMCNDLNVKFNRCGQYLCFTKNNLLIPVILTLPYFNLTAAGRAHFVGRKKLFNKEPGISKDIKYGLYFDGAGTVCPYGLTIALAENAIENGVAISLDTAVISIKVEDKKITSVQTNRGEIYPKMTINAAGVFCEEIAKMAGDRFFSIHPRKGTNAILDKEAKKNINTIYTSVNSFNGDKKSNHTKGGGIVSTVDGNVLVGPNAIETSEKENFDTEKSSIDNIFKKQKKAGTWLSGSDIITYFTGVRAATYEEDFIVEKGRNTKNIIHSAGIQSPGLTASPAIAVEIATILKNEMPDIIEKTNFNKYRNSFPRISEMDEDNRREYIEENPDYGEIVCRCEEISKGEIVDAMRSPLRCDTVDGIKRRARPGMGRCQGGFCGPQVAKMISEEKGIPLNKVRKGYEDSYILLGEKNEI
ncbi:MAG: FAD-dependent oxidoreductase [Peptostreptococcaceae bacterium]|nr:FAD-dependent oxidoreductase [Peptostreptococcaceae bacterium]